MVQRNIFRMIIFLIGVFLLSGCGISEKASSLGYVVEEFKFMNHEREHLTTADYKGSVWFANFIFTNCDTICPPMTANMARVQQRLIEEEISVPIVSFSVDPARDTPEVLKEFAEGFDVDFDTWYFVTGYSQEEIEQFALTSFKTLVQMPEDSDQVIHGSSFYLVDEDGIVVKSYNGVSLPSLDDIVTDIKQLQ